VHICIGSVYAWARSTGPSMRCSLTTVVVQPSVHDVHHRSGAVGLSAAFGGPWVERRGPRVAATAPLCCRKRAGDWRAGLALKQSVLVFLGMGVIGGIGCGLGYISPVSTLVKWFPDRREWPPAWRLWFRRRRVPGWVFERVFHR